MGHPLYGDETMARWSNVRVVSDCGTVVAVDVGEVTIEVRRERRYNVWWLRSQDEDMVKSACDHLSLAELFNLLWALEHVE